MNKKYNLKLDLQFRCNNSKMIFDEFDENTSDFFMQITRQGQEIDISNTIPTLLALKPSGVAVSQILNIKDNLIYGNLNNSLKNEVGTYIAKLMLIEGDKKTFISNISYEVTENALLGKIDDDIVEDERYSILIQLLERLSNIELQEQTRVDNESSRIEAENLREKSIEKIKNDIDFLVNETNKKVNDNLNSNTSKIDNLIIDTKEELNEYKNNKDIAINEDLKEFKENTNKSIDNYKAFKDIEIDNALNTYKTNTTNDINSFKNTVNSKIDKYKNDKDKAINKYIEDKNLELDNYVEVKSNELDLYVSEKNALIDSKISEVDSAKTQMQNSINNKLIEVDNAEQIRQQEHESRQQFLNGFEGKLNTIADDVSSIKDGVVSVKEANKRQDIFLQGLYNENLDGRVTVKEEGSVVSLTNSDDGLVDIVGLEGNTLVNYVTDGAKELNLNGDIDVEGTSVTLTEGVDKGKVDVMCEGNTLVNLMYEGTNIGGNYGTHYVGADVNVRNDFASRLKSSTTYTVILYDAPDEIFGVYFSGVKSELEVKPNVFILTTNAGQPTGEQFHFYAHQEIFGEKLSAIKVVILEGDYTNKPIPQEYFEGMKSVGECEDNKIEIVSTNENLFDKTLPFNEVFGDPNYDKSVKYDFENDLLVTQGKHGDANSRSQRHKLKPNTTYSFYAESVGTTHRVAVKDNGIMLRESSSNTTDIVKCTFTTVTGDIRITYIRADEKPTGLYGLRNISIVEGSTPKKVDKLANKKEITLSEPLRALPNGVKDKIVKINGKWYVQRNCGEVTLNGSENWNVGGKSNSSFHILYYIKDKGRPNNMGATGNSCMYEKYKTVNWTSTDEGMFDEGWYNASNIMYFPSNGVTSLTEAKNRLRNNPTKVVYPLATPTYEEITDPIINTYNDITHISNNSTIPCNMQIKNTGYNAIIKPSTQYTVAFDTDTSGEVGINLAGSKVTTNNNVATVTTPSTLVDDSLRLIGKGIKASNIRLLEGNKTNWIPSYFEGMKSSFEDKLQDDGTYKMEILSNNKNLATELIPYDSLGGDVLSTTIVKSNGNSMGCLFKVKPNTKYMFKKNRSDNRFRAFFFINNPIENPNEVSIGGAYSDNYDYMFLISPYNARYCYLVVTGNYIDNPVLWYQATEGSTNIDYIPHKSNKIQFSSIEPLRGVGDVKDRFVFKDNKLMIERRFSQIKIKDSMVSSIYKNNETESTIAFRFSKMLYPNWQSVASTSRSNLLYKIGSVAHDKEGYNSGDTSSDFYIRINKFKLDELTVEGMKKWLRNNEVVLSYQLTEPIYEEMPFELQKLILEGYENGTLFFDTNIPPTVEANYTADIPVVSKLNKVNETTEANTEDIAITQMAVDFLLMSSLGEEMLNFKVRSGYNMASYFANRIIKGALKYKDVVNKYPQYKEDINSILISEGYSDLIVEL